MRKAAMWHKKYANRYRWAYDAYERFVSEIDPSLAGDFQRSSHVTVAVYGATQVGKTTLILDLLGITGESLERASNVLRGEQRMGKSSTACAIRYGRSKDNNWYLDDDGVALDDAGARQRFCDIRRSLEEGQAQSIDVLSVRIPAVFFEHSAAGSLSLDLRILDIPGINAVNEAEQAQVARVAEKYVATADLILLVGRADDLGFLHPSKLKLAALSDWMLQANRFRIVLSYTFSPASFKTWFGFNRPTMEKVRAKIYAELGTHDYAPPKSVEGMLFPLEFGDSLNSLKADADYHQAAADLISQLRGELLASISESASPYGRLASAFRVKSLIDARLAREQGYYDKRMEDVAGELQEADSALTLARRLKSEFEREGRTLDVQGRRLRRHRNLAEKSDFKRHFAPSLPSTPESVSALKAVAVDFENVIQAQWKATCARHARHQANSRLEELSPPDTNALNSFYQKMNGYMTDGYWWSSDNFRADRNMLLQAAERIATAYSEAASLYVRKYLDHQAAYYKDKQLEYKRRLNFISAAVEEREKLLAQVKKKRDQLIKDHEQFRARMQYSIEHSQKFEHYIYEAFHTEVTSVREAIRHPVTAVEQVYNLFYLHVLLGELDKMLEGKKF